MSRQQQIIRLLADGRLHSGEAIAERLGISRAAVWKSLRKADEEFGLGIETVKGQGYRLPEPLELLDVSLIQQLLTETAAPCPALVQIHDDIDSTNTRLMQQASEGAPSGSVCLAERQRDGRGRQGRRWISPFGVNLYLSVLWRYAGGPAQLGGLSLAAGVAVAEALQGMGAQDIGLKWPNDVHWHRRKLAGLLLEVAGEAQGPSHVVVGVGINLRMDRTTDRHGAAAIDQPWVDLREVMQGEPCSRNALAAACIARLFAVLARYDRDGLAPFRSDWLRFDAYRGERVSIHHGDRRILGTHVGIGEGGELLLEQDGRILACHAGEVSLRGTVARGE